MKNRMPTFTSITRTELGRVTGGSLRVSASSQNNDVSTQMQQMLTQIGDAIKDLGKNRSSSTDQMLPMMMMMMMGGGGGGGGSAAAAPPPAPAPTYVNVKVRA